MADSKDFVVKDRRAFSKDGQTEKEPDQNKEAIKPEKKDKADTAAESGKKETAQEDAEQMSRLPEINFSTFIMSLNASALVSLGVIDDPASGGKNRNLPLGKQTIDILAMLEKKTRGNLTGDEEQMLKGILYELRMLYVKESK